MKVQYTPIQYALLEQLLKDCQADTDNYDHGSGWNEEGRWINLIRFYNDGEDCVEIVIVIDDDGYAIATQAIDGNYTPIDPSFKNIRTLMLLPE